MSIELNENTRAIVFAPFSRMADFMAAINEDVDGKFRLKGRVRFYEKENDERTPFEDGDRKSWFESKKGEETLDVCLEQIAQTIAKITEFSKLTGRGVGGETFLLLRGEMTFEEFWKEFTNQPFAHCKVLTEEEFRKLGGDCEDR